MKYLAYLGYHFLIGVSPAEGSYALEQAFYEGFAGQLYCHGVHSFARSRCYLLVSRTYLMTPFGKLTDST